MMNLYYINAYHSRNFEWWRFAVSAATADEAAERLRAEYSDMRLSRINAVMVCTTIDDVCMEL